MTGPVSRSTTTAAGGRIRSGHVPNPFATPYQVAFERGFFRDEGLDLESSRVPNGSVVADAIAAGDLDIGTGGHLQTAIAVAAGSDQVFIAPLGFERSPDHLCIVLIARRDRVRSLGDLAGRPVAVSARGAISELQLRLALPGPAARAVPMPFARMRDALASGEVDAASVVEPFASEIANDPRFVTLDRGSLSRSLPTGERVLLVGLVARKSWIEADPDRGQRLVRAVRRAIVIVLSDPDVARRAIADSTRADAAAIDAATLPLFDTELRPRDLQLAYDLAADRDLMTGRMDAARVIAPS